MFSPRYTKMINFGHLVWALLEKRADDVRAIFQACFANLMPVYE